MRPLLRRLRKLLEEYNGEATDVVDALVEGSGDGESAAGLRRIQTLVHDFDYDAALQALAEIETSWS